MGGLRAERINLLSRCSRLVSPLARSPGGECSSQEEGGRGRAQRPPQHRSLPASRA